jgi:hypothetical protein
MTRLLRIEIRRSALLPLLPVMAAALWFTPLIQHLRHLGPVALWIDRSTELQSAIQIIGPFTAAAAAWTASRERRRAMTGLLASTPLAPWRRWTVTWAATGAIAAAFYACLGLAVFAVTSPEATWGHLIAWPALSALTAAIACSALGFAAGRLAPGRVTTPLAAIGVFAAMAAGIASAVQHGGPGMLSPMYPSITLNASVFYPIRPDLTYLQAGCYLGVTAAALGLAALGDRAAGRAARRAGAAVTAAGLALAAAAAGLLSAAHLGAHDLVVPLLHNTATGRPVPYTPVCTRSRPLPVCLHPAYAAANELAFFTATVTTIAAPLAGTPGLPVRAAQSTSGDEGSPDAVVTGSPPVLQLPDDTVQGSSIGPAGFTAELRTRIALALVIPPGTDPGGTSCHCAAARLTTPAQQATALYLLDQAGYAPSPDLIPGTPALAAAARGLAALAPPARHAWLTAHIAALRAGALPLTELP